jgi:hypothetical protein
VSESCLLRCQYCLQSSYLVSWEQNERASCQMMLYRFSWSPAVSTIAYQLSRDRISLSKAYAERPSAFKTSSRFRETHGLVLATLWRSTVRDQPIMRGAIPSADPASALPRKSGSRKERTLHQDVLQSLYKVSTHAHLHGYSHQFMSSHPSHSQTLSKHPLQNASLNSSTITPAFNPLQHKPSAA